MIPQTRLLLILIPLSLLGSLTAAAEQVVQVNNDFGKGVKSKISVLLGDNPTAKGATDDTGKFAVTDLCKPGEQVQAEPMNDFYYKGVTDCSAKGSRIVVKVTAKAFAANLVHNASYFEGTGDFGNAAMSYTEYATRMAKVAPKQASEARIKAYLSFAKTLKISEEDKVVSFDAKQETLVLTPEFVELIKNYQTENGFKATGQLDFATLKAQADAPITELGTKQFGSEQHDE